MKKVFPIALAGIQVVLFVLYPFVFLLAKNPHYHIEFESLKSMGLILAIALLFWVVLGAISKSFAKSALIVSLFSLLFFSFEACKTLLIDLKIGGFQIGSDLSVFVLMIVFFVLLTYFIVKLKKYTDKVLELSVYIALILIFINLVPFLNYRLSSRVHDFDWKDNYERQSPKNKPDLSLLPDIYYIIPDMFARPDVLTNLYKFNGNALVREFRQRGFYVAEKSTSNYVFSLLSIGSTLNMDYLNSVTDLDISDTRKEEVISNMNKNNLVMETFKELGYKTITFSPGYFATDIRKADVVFGTNIHRTEFQQLLISMTPIDKILGMSLFASATHHEMLRNKVLSYFDQIAEIAEWEEPTFTFLHLLSPHWPFVFGPNGESVTPRKDRFIAIRKGESQEYIDLYHDQVTFITKKILAMIDQILEKSDKPPIIIIQSDHGPDAILDYSKPSIPGLMERFSILNAYYFPHGGDKLLFQNITPVNSFRLLFNYYFGTGYDLLPNRNFFSYPETKENAAKVKMIQEVTQIVQPYQMKQKG